eukprot:CAMPEP_0176400652 /NCGR_PEP_ID=MMETSP0126-20121128/47783_1 /TAXON_ID=141414 ORGANISM="Strombidinopsis acuminatum, Strain SPMC142" /NCGR_SAMPLE_ID=MMETSP0126 /ASSEMBLY_ACC=CAM_ASM_000229 /LENGTH=71 /DNA_ID=CAMNT_0017777065 /DNA_START=1020 /DNA_END=1235 /DNA_ORIENTATION=-
MVWSLLGFVFDDYNQFNFETKMVKQLYSMNDDEDDNNNNNSSKGTKLIDDDNVIQEESESDYDDESKDKRE